MKAHLEPRLCELLAARAVVLPAALHGGELLHDLFPSPIDLSEFVFELEGATGVDLELNVDRIVSLHSLAALSSHLEHKLSSVSLAAADLPHSSEMEPA